MTDVDTEPKEALPDLALWDGLQEALKLGHDPKKKRKRGQTAPAKSHPGGGGEAAPTPGTSAAIKLGNREERAEREENEFRCESCGKSWARYGFFIKHVKKQHDISAFIAGEQKVGVDSGAKIRCRFCHRQVAKGEFFEHFWRLHVEQDHPHEAQLCLLCNKSLAGLEKLRWHLRVIHFNELHIEPTKYGADVSKVFL